MQGGRFVRILAYAVFIWLFCLASVLLHELGHALGCSLFARGCGWRVYAGSGPEMIGTKRFSIRPIAFGGYFFPERELDTRKQRIAMLIGGPLTSLILTVLFGVLRFYFYGFQRPWSDTTRVMFYVSNFLTLFNLFQFLFTAIPIRSYRLICRGQESDGMKIVKELKREK